GGWLLLKLGWQDRATPVPVDVVAGGGPQGVGPGEPGGPAALAEEVNPEAGPERKPLTPVPLKDVDPTRINPDLIPRLTDEQGKRVVDPAAEAIKGLAALGDAARGKMLGGISGERKVGPGKDGGKGKLAPRVGRVLRWVLVFNTQNGGDYARQLAG